MPFKELHNINTSNYGTIAGSSGVNNWDDMPESSQLPFFLELPINMLTSSGCDSTAILNLTINNSDTSNTEITACDS